MEENWSESKDSSEKELKMTGKKIKNKRKENQRAFKMILNQI